MILPLDEYSQHHLLYHLAQSERYADISTLVSLRDWYETKLGSDFSAGTYIKDLFEARVNAGKSTAISTSFGTPAPSAIREAGHALALSSLYTAIRKVRGGHISERVVDGDWDVEEALNLLLLLPDSESSVGILREIIDQLEPDHVRVSCTARLWTGRQ